MVVVVVVTTVVCVAGANENWPKTSSAAAGRIFSFLLLALFEYMESVPEGAVLDG